MVKKITKEELVPKEEIVITCDKCGDVIKKGDEQRIALFGKFASSGTFKLSKFNLDKRSDLCKDCYKDLKDLLDANGFKREKFDFNLFVNQT